MTTWSDLFDRGAAFGATEDAILEALEARRDGGRGDDSGTTEGGT
jgi:hypothetical protein